MAAVWQLLHIRTRHDGDRTIVDPNGAGDVLHWADPELARAWIQKAEEAIDPQRVRDADAGGHNAQVALLVTATNAIANAYNAMNILWENDPLARQRYRSFLSGPPASVSSEYSLDMNYGRENWYRKDDSFPSGGGIRIVDGEQVRPGNFLGRIPALARQMFLRDYPLGQRVADMHPSEFRQSVGVYVDVQGPVDPQGRPIGTFPDLSATKSRVNRPFVMGDIPQELLPNSSVHLSPENWCRSNTEGGLPFFTCPKWVGAYAWLGGLTLGASATLLTSGGVVCGPAPVAIGKCANLDWHQGMFIEAVRFYVATDDLNPFVSLPVWGPLRDYLPWLEAWISDLGARSPEQIILDSRKFVVQQNVEWITAYGSLPAFVEQVLGQQQQRLEESHTPDPTVQMVASTVTALGASLGIVVPIAAIAGAIIGAGITIINQAAVHPVSGFKDDLGHYKPSFALGWLGGRGPGYPDVRYGAPDPEILLVPEPPGFVRGGRVAVAGAGAGEAYLRDLGLGCGAWARITDPAARTIRVRSASVNRGMDPAEGDRRRILIDAFCANQNAPLSIKTESSADTTPTGTKVTTTKVPARPGWAPPSASQTSPLLTVLSDTPATPVDPRKLTTATTPKKIWPWVVGGVAVLGVAGAGGYWWTHRDVAPK
jgi:hypothetical protein